MIRVAIGPSCNSPSWNWIGFDTARELSKYFKVRIFEKLIPACDVALVVKSPLSRETVPSDVRIVYFPVDYFRTPIEVRLNYHWLKRCDAIGCHCERQLNCFRRYCDNIYFLEHHGRFLLPQIAPHRRYGHVLWIGAIENIPFLLRWREEQPKLPYCLKILTNLKNEAGIRQAECLSRLLGISRQTFTDAVCGPDTFEWSEKSQFELMSTAMAGIDIKGCNLGIHSDWSQQMKPPTKAQQFIASGIPFACNSDSYHYEYFSCRGLPLSDPSQTDFWFSSEYWKQTVNYAAKAREFMSLESVGKLHKSIIEEVMSLNPK